MKEHAVRFQFLIDGEYAEGTGFWRPRFSASRPSANHYLCPECGNVWASIIPQTPHPFHQAISHACSSCADRRIGRYFVPGSVLLSHEPWVYQALPVLLLVREFLLHFAHAERYFPEAI